MLTALATLGRTDNQTAKQISRRRLIAIYSMMLMAVGMFVLAGSMTANGQRAGAKKDEKLKPRVVKLKTKDAVEISAFYVPSAKGKDAVTIMLVHEWQGQASPYGPLVASFQKAGFAVLVPDYRGHGGSTKYTDRRGTVKTFDLSRMSKIDVQNIVLMDIEKSKGFLKEENNEGNLNLNALVMVGVREGCVMAANFAQRDWSFPSIGRMKQGQDVKGLVLISPDSQVKGIAIDPVLRDPNILRLPILIVGGKDNPESKDTNRIARRIEGTKQRAGGGEASGFGFEMLDTSLTGPSLANEKSVIAKIVEFIQNEVPVSDSENPWVDRS